MKIYIPQKIDPYNTHLKNLKEAYESKGIDVMTGFDHFTKGEVLPDIIHFHFIDPVLKYLKYDEDLFFRKLDYFCKNGALIIYTFHDSQPHSKITGSGYQNLYMRFLNFVSMFVHHGQSSIEIFLKKYPQFSGKKHIVCHHGDYMNDMKSFKVTKEKSREILKLPSGKDIILIFGQLQYKNSGFAYEVFDRVKKKYPGSILLMAGVFPVFRYNRINKIYYRINNRLLNFFRSGKIRILKRFSQYETYLLFQSADVIFLPHNTGLTTGIIPMAATLGRPFVYPDIGVFEEQARYCLAEKYNPGDDLGAFRAIDKLMAKNISTFENTLWLEANNWEKHVDHILTNL